MANYIKSTAIQENSISETKLDSSLQSWKETVTNHINNNDNPHNITKSSIGLDNVTNDAQVKRSELGVANGVATLDSTGKVPSGQLPSYVDDVIEGYLYNGVFYKDTSYTTSIVGESGKIYIDLPTNKTYRWTGSVYGVISETIALGETSSTAYRGDRGKIAYDHSQSAHAPSNAQANVIETIKVNGTALTPNSKAVDITIPTIGNGTITIKQGGTSKGTFTTNQNGNTTIELTDTNTTYTAGDGLSLSGTTFSNNGVRSIATGTTNGTISVNTNGNISNIEVYGLKSAAYTNSSDYAAASHTHSYLPLSGGTITSEAVAPLALKSTSSSGHSILQFISGETYLGALGFKGLNDPYFRTAEGTFNTLIHSGNIRSQVVKGLSMNYVNNLDNATIGELFSSDFKATNIPSTNYATGLTIYNNQLKYNYQLAFSTYAEVFVRYKDSSAWQSWKQIAFTDSNVASSSKWETPRTITLTGSVTGSVSIDGSQNVSLATTTNHTHTFASLTDKPTTISGYGITDAYTASTIDSKLSGYLPLGGGILNANKSIGFSAYSAFSGDGGGGWAVNAINLYDRVATKRFGGLGYFGSYLNLGYIYLGTESYSGVNLRIYGTGQSDLKWGDNTVLHSGNFNSYCPKLDGTGATGTWGISISGNAATATNANTLDGYHATMGSNQPWGTIPVITPQGWMEVGKHFEFHYDNTTGSDYSTALACTGNHGNTVYLPSASGTLALLTDNVASASNADTLDGYHADSFTKKLDLVTTDLNSIGDSLLGQQSTSVRATPELHYPVQEAGGLISILSAYSSTNQIYGTHLSNRWFARGSGTSLSSRTSWREFAFLDSNVASATKLQNSRTIWGQSFDGTGNVSGALTGVTDITASGNAIIDGYVGIGTQNPAYQLDVKGDIRVANGNISLNVRNAQDTYFISADAYNGLLAITSSSRPSNPAFLMSNQGYVNLNCDSPGFPAYPLVVNGTISCTKLLQTSDIKYKTNIKQIEYEEALKIIENLNPVTWDWNENTVETGSSSGFVAQEAEEFIPNAISRDNENNLSLDYTQLHSYEIKVIQEQQKEIKDLKQRLEVLENLVLQLTNREI